MCLRSILVQIMKLFIVPKKKLNFILYEKNVRCSCTIFLKLLNFRDIAYEYLFYCLFIAHLFSTFSFRFQFCTSSVMNNALFCYWIGKTTKNDVFSFAQRPVFIIILCMMYILKYWRAKTNKWKVERYDTYYKKHFRRSWLDIRTPLKYKWI